MTVLWVSLITMLLLGFPFMIVIFGSLFLHLGISIPGFNFTVLIQQMVTGMTPRRWCVYRCSSSVQIS